MTEEEEGKGGYDAEKTHMIFVTSDTFLNVDFPPAFSTRLPMPIYKIGLFTDSKVHVLVVNETGEMSRFCGIQKCAVQTMLAVSFTPAIVRKHCSGNGMKKVKKIRTMNFLSLCPLKMKEERGIYPNSLRSVATLSRKFCV